MAFKQGAIQANSFKPLRSCIVFTASLAAGSTAYTSRASARADRSWFANVTRHDTAQSVDKIIDHSLRNLRSFSDSLRQAVSLTQSYATMRHFALAEQQKSGLGSSPW
jgi:hypothetical protein